MRGANLQHINGLEIACGNPDHLLELLQILHQLTVMMAESPSQSSPGTSGVNHPELSPGGNTAQKESALQIKDQMNENNNQDDDDEDDYDDEEMDEDDNQRLSPLHRKIDKKPSQ